MLSPKMKGHFVQGSMESSILSLRQPPLPPLPHLKSLATPLSPADADQNSLYIHFV